MSYRRWALSAFALMLAGAEPARPRWLGDLEAARKAARAERRPIFAVFRCEH